MTPPDRIYWRETDGGGYATIYDPSDLPGGTTGAYVPAGLTASPEHVERLIGEWDAQAQELRDGLREAEKRAERLKEAYEATKARETAVCRQLDALQDDLEQREAALGRALQLARELWDAPGARSLARSVPYRLLAPGIAWADVLRWIADGPGPTGGDDGQADAEPPGPPPVAPGPASVEGPPVDGGCVVCGAGLDDPCERRVPGPPCPRAQRVGSGERVDPARVSPSDREQGPPIRPGNGWTH